MKKTNKEKYFYSEIEDKIIVDFVKSDFKRRQEERRPYELTWELNMNFYLGNQYSYISNSGELSDIEKRYYWENREVFNHIAPVIEARLAKLSKVKPNLSVKPSGNSEHDIYSSKLTKAILKSTIENNSLSNLISTATHWSEITGTCFYKICWDNSLGNTIGKLNETDIKNGDVSISICSPFEIYPDSNSSTEIEDCESIIEARAFPVSKINESWNLNLKGEDIDIYELNNNSFISNISGRSNITKIIHSTKQNHVLLLERYEKPSIKNPNGKLTIVCEDKLLYDGELPYKLGKNGERNYPFIKQISTKQLANFWGISVIERCIPLQRTYNAIKNKKHEFIAKLASGVLSVEDGSVDIDNLEEEGLAPGKILIYRNGANPPEFLNPGSIPAELENEEEKLLNELNNLCCVSDITINNNIPNNVNSGSALSLLISQDESRLSLTAENIRTAIQKIGNSIIKLYKQYATTKRLNKILDDNGTLELFYWTNSDLNCDDVVLEFENELEESIKDKRDYILKLFNAGLFYDENGKINSNTKNKILTVLGLNSWETYETTDELHKKRANRENLQLIKLDKPMQIDNHSIHIDEHIRFLISDQSENINEELKNNLLKHIEEHKTVLY